MQLYLCFEIFIRRTMKSENNKMTALNISSKNLWIRKQNWSKI